MGKRTYAMGVILSVHMRTMGGGVNFLPFSFIHTT